MPKVLILCAHRPNRSPSQRYRFEQYLPLFLEENGFTFTWSFLLNEEDDKLFYSNGNFFGKISIILKSLSIRKKDTKRFKDFDIIFIQREANFLGNSYFEKKAFLSGAKVIFDFDDSIWLADTSPGNKKWQWIKNPQKFFDNINYAHTIIAGNEYLLKKTLDVLSIGTQAIDKNKVKLIPTTINTDIHFPKTELRNKEIITIGWSGSISTIKHFELLVPVLKKIKDKYLNKVRFKIIGDSNYKNSELNLESVAWSEKTEVNDLNTFDIGLMPLPNDEWANGKCGLKGLSYMACGISTIMSNVGVNNQIIVNGVNGFLAGTENEWYEKLCELIENKNLRIKLGEEGRKTVIEKYSVIANKHKYLDVFKQSSIS